MPRVLHVLRSDHSRHIGGDLVMLRATVEALTSQGIDAVAGRPEDATGSYDVAHFYNLNLPIALARDIRTTLARWPSARVVISPLLWPPDPRLIVRAPDSWTRRRVARTWLGICARWPFVRRLLQRADAVVPNAGSECRRLTRLFQVSPNRWLTVPNGLVRDYWPARQGAPSERARAALGLGARANTALICVARLEPYKNQLTLVRALEHLPDAGLVLVGPDLEYPDYAAAVRAAASRYPDRVVFKERCSDAEVRALLSVADVHVLPSFRELPGLATLEAAAAGCEVVATRHGSTEEYLGPLAGYTDATSPVGIADAVRDVIARPRQPALRRRAEEFDWSVAAHSLAKAYRRLTDPQDAASR